MKGAVEDHNRIHTRKRKQEVTAASAVTGKRGSSPTGVIHVGAASSSLLFPPDSSAGKRNALDDVIKASFVREASTQFFQLSFRNVDMRSYIVARACFGLGNGHYTHIEKDEVDMHLSTALLCVQVTRSQREILANTVQLTISVSRKDRRVIQRRAGVNFALPISNHLRAEPLTTASDYRRSYMEGKNSILSNLPHPHVTVVSKGTGDSYISLKEIVADFLAKGVEIVGSSISDNIVGTQVTPFSMSSCIDDLIREGERLYPGEDFHVIWIMDWSDGYVAFNVKKADADVWAKTVTLGYCHPKSREKSFEVTYPIAMGTKQKTHDKVEQAMLKDLLELSSGQNRFYVRGHDSPVRVHVKLVASLQDQPERRSANHLVAGNSKFHARWGYSANIAAFASKLPACPNCHDEMKVNRRLLADCQVCTNWEMEQSPNTLTEFDPPDHYPKACSGLTSSGKLVPIRLSYDVLRDACSLAFQKVSDGSWNLIEGEQFLTRHCLVDDLIKDILSPAALSRQAQCSLQKDEEDRNGLDRYVLGLYESDPKLFAPLDVPALWKRGLPLTGHVDVIMHLLFLGVGKSTHRVIVDWMKLSSGSYQQYSDLLENCLNREDFPSVEWCKVAPYTGEKFGGWVSENHLALMRLSNWIAGITTVKMFSEHHGGRGPVESTSADSTERDVTSAVESAIRLYSTETNKDVLVAQFTGSLGLTWYALTATEFHAPSDVKEKWRLYLSANQPFGDIPSAEVGEIAHILALDENKGLLQALLGAGINPPMASAPKKVFKEWLEKRRVTYARVLDLDFDLPQSIRDSCLMTLGKKCAATTIASSGDKPLLVSLVTTFYLRHNRHKIPIVQEGGSQMPSSYSDIQELTRTMVAMVASVMAPQYGPGEITDMDIIIRLFLTRFSKVEQALRHATGEYNKMPKWLSSYNFVCLLNLPNAAKYYGPLRNTWEGGMRGEKFIQAMKPELAQGKRGTWQVYALTNILQDATLKWLMKLQESPVESGIMDSDLLVRDRYVCVYEDATCVRSLLDAGVTPVSALEIQCRHLSGGSESAPTPARVVIAVLNHGLCVVVTCDPERREAIAGTTYFRWSVSYDEVMQYKIREYKKLGMIRAMLLLPIRIPGTDGPLHSAIDSDWHELTIHANPTECLFWNKPSF